VAGRLRQAAFLSRKAGAWAARCDDWRPEAFFELAREFLRFQEGRARTGFIL
jgi:hypothetical protein